METDNQRFNAAVEPNSAFLAELKEKLPEFFTRDNSFDLEKFQAALKEKNVSELSEGYQLNFIGKDYARRQAGEMPTTVIVPDEDQNNGAGKNSQNLFFTGDNLEVLRHLQNNYQNKIDVIYIDPPYNTGSDGFVYPDSFEYSDDKLKEMFGMNDDQVARLKSIQGKASHSAWLTFMYPRLALAKRLLANDGVIFISIDDNEQSNLKELMDEIFGEVNYIDTLVWKGKGGGQDSTALVKTYESILCYVKNIDKAEFSSYLVDEDQSSYNFYDKKKKLKYKRQLARKWGSNSRRQDRPNLYFPVKAPDGTKIYPHLPDGTDGSWRHSKERLQLEIENGDFEFVKSSEGQWELYQKIFANKDGKKEKKFTNLIDNIPSGTGSKYLKNLFNGISCFDYPKPVELIKRLISMKKEKKIVLDFFAGSSTTADAVMQLNAEDGGHRKFIMVQLPEKTYHTNSDGSEVPTKGGKAAYEAGFRSIDEISRERIRRAAAKIKADNELTLPADFDGSFKHYRVVKPSRMTLDRIEEFKPETDELVLDTVNSFSSQTLGVAGNASGEQTVLATWLAKDGYPFDVDVQKIGLAGYQGNLIENNRLYLIREGWSSKSTEKLLNLLGTHALNLQAVVIFGYSFNLNDLRELENGLKQLDGNVSLIKRY